jgi:hypothetical protein
VETLHAPDREKTLADIHATLKELDIERAATVLSSFTGAPIVSQELPQEPEPKELMQIALSQFRRIDLQAFVDDPSIATGGVLILCRDPDDGSTVLYEFSAEASAAFISAGLAAEAPQIPGPYIQ